MSLGTLDDVKYMQENDPIISVDTETSWTDFDWERYLLGTAIYSPSAEKGWYFPDKEMSDEVRQALKLLLNTREKMLFHNAKFDIRVLSKAGLLGEVGADRIEDTMLIAWLLQEDGRHDLKGLSERFVEKGASDMQKVVKQLTIVYGWENIPSAIMAQYAVQDVRLTYLLWKRLRPMLTSRKLDEVLFREYMFLFCLMDMESHGILIDKELAASLSLEAETKLKSLQSELGIDPLKPAQLARSLFLEPPTGLGLNPRGYSGVRSKLFPLGRPKMDEEILLSYGHPFCDRVLEYRHIQKEKSTYIDAWLSKCSPESRYYPYFLQHGTVTGRLSGNMQQVPRKGLVKSLLRAPVGASLVEVDYSQVELRLAAVIANEPGLKRAFKTNHDIHQEVADQLDVDRQMGKMVNFLILYGGGASKLSESAGIPYSRAEKIIAQYHETYPNIRRTSSKLTAQALARGHVTHWTGRHRNMNQDNAHKAFNAIIQGGAAEIMKQSMMDLMYNHRDLPIKIVSQVHDSLWIEVPTAEREEVIDKVKEVMEWPGREWDIPFPVDAKILWESPV